jgi:hypothetical protein
MWGSDFCRELKSKVGKWQKEAPGVMQSGQHTGLGEVIEQ